MTRTTIAAQIRMLLGASGDTEIILTLTAAEADSLAQDLEFCAALRDPVPFAPRLAGRGEMTPQQKALARHALGLPNTRGQSYRNRYWAPEAPSFRRILWHKMLLKGFAESGKPLGGQILFWLTEQGARLALEPGETLCPEDFPQSTGAADANA